MHTPGPWEVDWNDEDNIPVFLFENDDPVICIWGPDGQGYGRVAMAYAETGNAIPNARLIAAAPDLLEALEQIATSPHQDYSTNEHSLYGTGVADGHKCAANIAKQAIEKAKGG